METDAYGNRTGKERYERGRDRIMSIEKIGNGYVKIGVSQEDLEDSIAGLSQLKPILQAQVIKSNGSNGRQAAIDCAELGKHFDTAIDSMTMLLAEFEEYREQGGENH